MVDISQEAQQTSTPPIIGLLPGSKGMKLAQGVPLLVATASVIRRQRPAVQFLLPVAPTITVQTLLHYGDRQRNPMVKRFAAPAIELCHTGDQPYLQVADGTQIQLITDFPAHQDLRQCQLCLTTVGANTAELGALGLPMLVLLPTQQLDAMRAWDGIPVSLRKFPGWEPGLCAGLIDALLPMPANIGCVMLGQIFGRKKILCRSYWGN